MRYLWIFTFMVLGLFSCVTEKGELTISGLPGEAPAKSAQALATVSSVTMTDGDLIINGNNLSGVTTITLTDNASFTESFTLKAGSNNTMIIADATRAITIAAGVVLDLIISDAQGTSTFPVDFNLPQMGAADGDVLTWNNTLSQWEPQNLNGVNLISSWNPTTNTPTLSDGGGTTFPTAGDYYVVTTACPSVCAASTIDGIDNWLAGDWIIFNGATWDKVVNTNSVVDVFGMQGSVTFGADTLTDIDTTTTPPSSGDVLQWDGANWVPATNTATGLGSNTNTTVSADDDNNASGDIVFQTATTTKMTLSNAGDLAIGSSAPNEKLTVDGVMSLNEVAAPTNTANYGKLYVKSSDSQLYFMDDAGTEFDLLNPTGDNDQPGDVIINADNDNSGAGDDILFNINGTTEMIIQNDGDVGINTTSPAARLHVSGTALNNGSAPPVALIGGVSGTLGVAVNTQTNYHLEVRENYTASNMTNSTYASIAATPTLTTNTTSTGNTIYGLYSIPSLNAANAGEKVYGVYSNPSGAGAGSPDVYSAVFMGGSVGIGNTTPDGSSLLDLTSTTQGLLMPRMTTVQRDAIGSPATGLTVYNTTTNELNNYNGSAWIAVGSGSAGYNDGDTILAADGNSLTPGLSFNSDPDTGFYKASADSMHISLGGTPSYFIGSSIESFTNQSFLLRGSTAGTAALPTYTFRNDVNTGLYSPNADELSLSTNGNDRLFIGSSGNIGAGTTSPNASSILDLTSTTLGFLPPRMTTTQRDAIGSPATGLTVYNTTTNQLNTYNGSAWVAVGISDHGALSGLTDDDHTQYAHLSGRAGGQTLHGGTASGDDLTIHSTSNATKGDVIINPSQNTYFYTPEAGLDPTDKGLMTQYHYLRDTGLGTTSIRMSHSGLNDFRIEQCYNAACSSRDTMALFKRHGSSLIHEIGATSSSGIKTHRLAVGENITNSSGSLPFNINFEGAGNSTIGVLEAASGSGNDLTIQASDGATGDTDAAGGDLIFRAGASTGNAGGAIRLFTPNVGASGTATNTLSERLTVLEDGSVGINNATPDASSLLDLTSTTSGFLPPRMTTAQRDAIGSPATGLVVYNTSDNELNYYNGSSWTATGSGGGGSSDQRIIVSDRKPSGTAGGGHTAGSYETRDLNTVEVNEITGASLATNQVTLPAGTYAISGYAASYRTDLNKLRLQNITDGATTLLGSNNWSRNSDVDHTHAFIKGVFTIAATKTFEVQHRASNTQSTNGFGKEMSFAGDDEIYSTFEFIKLGSGGGGSLGTDSVTATELADDAVDTNAILDDAVSAAKIDLSSTSDALQFTNVTTAQRDAIGSPQEGMLVYNTDTDTLNVYANGAWAEVGSGGGGGFVSTSTVVYNAATPTTWTDLDLSSVVGSNATLVTLLVENLGAGQPYGNFRTNGLTEDVNQADQYGSGTHITPAASKAGIVTLPTDASGIVEFMTDSTSTTYKITVIGYIGAGGSGGSGTPANIQSVTKTDTFSHNTTTWTDIPGLAVTITPNSTSSQIVLNASVAAGNDNVNDTVVFRFTRDGSAIAVGDAAGSRPQSTWSMRNPDVFWMETSNTQFIDSPNTTSAVTYRVQVRKTHTYPGIVYINRSGNDADADYSARGISTMSAIELGSGGGSNLGDTDGVDVPNLASDPSSPDDGQMYFNTTTNKLMVYNGTSWQEVAASASSTMVSNWPDAIICSGTSGNVIQYFSYDDASEVRYVSAWTNPAQLRFNTNGTWNTHANGGFSDAGYLNDCLNKSISQLYADGQAFDLAGGGAGGSGGGISLSAEQAASGLNIDFTDVPVGTKKITISFTEISVSGTADPIIQIGSGSYETTGYFGGTYNQTGSVSTSNSNGFNVFNLTSAAQEATGVVNLILQDDTDNTWMVESQLTSGGGGTLYAGTGSKAISGALDQIRITTSNGSDTFDNGFINIQYHGGSNGGGSGSPKTLIVVDEKTSGTAGGTCTSGSYMTRDLNTVRTNTIAGASLSSNQITLPAGTYEIEATAPSYKVDRTKAKLYNVTDTADEILGSSDYNSAAYNGQITSTVSGQFTITATKTFEIRHRCETTKTSNGFGVESNFGDPEIYTQVKIKKID